MKTAEVLSDTADYYLSYSDPPRNRAHPEVV